MSDTRIDQELRRVSAALADAAPDAPALGGVPHGVGRTWLRPTLVGFGVALVAGVVGVVLLTSADRDDRPVASGEMTRWEWIVANSEATWSEDLLSADFDAAPWPDFDFTDLGAWQPIYPVEAILVEVPGLGGQDITPPFVHVGRIGPEEAGGPFDLFVVRQAHPTVGEVVCIWILGQGGGGADCHDPSGEADDLVAGIGEGGGSLSRVAFRVPRDTALLVVRMDDGQAFVQRPVVGVGAMLLDLEGSWIEYAEALAADGTVLLRDDFSDRFPPFDDAPATSEGTTTTVVEVVDPVLHVSGATTRYTTTGEILVEGFVDQAVQVTVGGVDATEHVDPDGRTTFWAELSLAPGEHVIDVFAIADAGGAAVVWLTIVVDPGLEEVFGYLGSFDQETQTMAVDTAEFLSGDAAVAAARTDGVIPADQGYVDGDFYIRNRVADARILPLADTAAIVLQACWESGPCVSTEQVDRVTWQLLLADPESGYDVVGWWWYGTGTLPYVFTIQDGVVVQVAEWYLP